MVFLKKVLILKHGGFVMNIVQSGEANKRTKNGLFYEGIVDHFNKIFYSLGNAPQAHPHRGARRGELTKL